MTTESDINKLLDKPYSELADEEIEQVIEWKASIKARDQQHEETLQAIRECHEERIKAMREQVKICQETQDELLEASRKRLAMLEGD